MATGTELFNMLDQRTRDVSNALDELNAVISGGTFDRTQIWPTTDVSDPVAHAAAIEGTMDGLSVTANLADAIDRLTEGLDASTIGDAIDIAVQAVQDVLTEISELNDELGVQDRIDAFNELNNPATPDRANPDFGFIPAIEGVINAAASTNVDADDALAPLAAVGAAIAAGGAYTVFAAYSLGSLDFLGRAFD